LQELLEPDIVVFCNANWKVIGYQSQSRWLAGLPPHIYGSSLQSEVSRITGIPQPFQSGSRTLREASIAKRMAWAARRQTSRIEDEAYCLLGIFGINMPLIYGEGNMAFDRLQDEIIKRSTDQSILAWEVPFGIRMMGPVLAPSPRYFPRIIDHTPEKMLLDHDHYTITNKGLLIQADLRVIELTGSFWDIPDYYCYLYLNYCINGTPTQIILRKKTHSERFSRTHELDFDRVDSWREGELLKNQLVYLAIGNEIVIANNRHNGLTTL
jgi:hypothetical protein